MLVASFPAVTCVMPSINALFSSSESSAGTLHLWPSLSLIPAEFIKERQASLFQVNPSINGWDVNASASGRGLVSLPTNNKSKSISSNPSSFAVFAISKFFPVKDFFSPWSCLSPKADTTAIGERSTFLSSREFAAK